MCKKEGRKKKKDTVYSIQRADTRSFMLLSASVNSISSWFSFPSPLCMLWIQKRLNSYELIFLLPSRNPCLLYVFFARKGNGPLSLSAFPTILTEIIFQNVKMTQDWKRFSRALVFDKNKWGYWNLLNQMHLFISQTIPRHIVRTKNESARRPEYK